MMKRTTLQVLMLCTMANAYAQLSPEVTSWLVNTNSASLHDILETNVEQVQYTDSDVYISCEAVPGYDVGPWDDPSMAPNQNFVFKLTRNPIPAGNIPLELPDGRIGVWTNGVSIFNRTTDASYKSKDVWHVDGAKDADPNTITCDGYMAENGEYFNYVAPICLYDANDKGIHSPILGYAFDGYPIYGAYAFANEDGSGGIVQMTSSYHLRQISSRTTLPDGSQLEENFWGPEVSNNYPLGHYIEDYEYVAGSGSLDERNGRFCVTPEYPQGTYAYFVTVDENDQPAYPYTLNKSFYGEVQTGNLGTFSGHNEISETVVTYISIGNVAEEIDMIVYPIPAQDYAYLYISPSYQNNILATITDLSGKVLLTMTNLQPGITYELNVSTAADGMYFLELQNGEAYGMKQFVIHRR